MHGEELVVLLLRRDNFQSRSEQLSSDNQRHDTTEQEVEERRDEVEVPNLLVICRGHPVNKDVTFARNTGIREALGRLGHRGTGSCGCHLLLLTLTECVGSGKIL